MDPEQRVRQSFERQTMMRTIGATLTRVAAGEVEIVLPFRAELLQQTGTMHGGIIAAIADTACGYAALTLMPDGSEVVSVEFKLNLLSPAIGARFTARGRVVRSGRTLSVCTADVLGDDDKLIATMLATMMRR